MPLIVNLYFFLLVFLYSSDIPSGGVVVFSDGLGTATNASENVPLAEETAPFIKKVTLLIAMSESTI